MLSGYIREWARFPPDTAYVSWNLSYCHSAELYTVSHPSQSTFSQYTPHTIEGKHSHPHTSKGTVCSYIPLLSLHPNVDEEMVAPRPVAHLKL